MADDAVPRSEGVTEWVDGGGDGWWSDGDGWVREVGGAEVNERLERVRRRPFNK